MPAEAMLAQAAGHGGLRMMLAPASPDEQRGERGPDPVLPRAAFTESKVAYGKIQ
jgi:hypothetical protein